MESSTEYVDELFREYLLFRGFDRCLASFDTALAADIAPPGAPPRRVAKRLLAACARRDRAALCDTWRFLERRFFSRLDERLAEAVAALWAALRKHFMCMCAFAGDTAALTAFLQVRPTPARARFTAVPTRAGACARGSALTCGLHATTTLSLVSDWIYACLGGSLARGGRRGRVGGVVLAPILQRRAARCAIPCVLHARMDRRAGNRPDQPPDRGIWSCTPAGGARF